MSRVSLRILIWGGRFYTHNYINIIYINYADFRTPKSLMTLMTHDIRDLYRIVFDEKSEQLKNGDGNRS